MKPIATLFVPLLAVMATGCASQWKPRSPTQATIYGEATEIPVLWADSTFVGAVDGVSAERGKGYVLVAPGARTLTVFHVNCPLPIIAVFCLKSAAKRDISSIVKAGAAYRIGWQELIEVRADGKSVELPSHEPQP